MGKILYKQHEGFGNRLKGLRKEKYKTQDEFAYAIGKHIESVRNWEQGRLLPEMATLLDICETLDCDLDYLIGRIDCKTHDIQSIHEQTGLSENAIKVLCDMRPNRIENVSFLLTNTRFQEILGHLSIFATLSKIELKSATKNNLDMAHNALDDQMIELYKMEYEFRHMVEEYQAYRLKKLDAEKRQLEDKPNP